MLIASVGFFNDKIGADVHIKLCETFEIALMLSKINTGLCTKCNRF